jgi:regulation of enolase protein 1 (concanavalin A-like superfamily)
MGNVFKRIDQAWSKFLPPVSMSRFGMVTPGYAAPSDHAGIVVEYAVPSSLIGTVPPSVSISSPADNALLTGKVTVSVAASDNTGISRVELLVDGVTMAVDTTSPYSFTWDTRLAANGTHVLAAAATDASGNRTVSLPRTVSVGNPSYPGDDVVMHGVEAQVVGASWSLVADSTAASTYRLQNGNAGVTAKTPSGSPASYVEFTFSANAGESYRLWIRGKAINSDPANDSVFVQFDGAVDASGAAIDRIGTTSAATVNLEECDGCGLSGWGWRDDGFPRDVIGTAIYFANTGTQRIRIQAREDGLGIDQVVLSAVKYRWTSPGLLKNDITILPSSRGGGNVPPPNVPPTVAMTTPVSGATFTAPATIALAATAGDSDGTVARVDFYAGSTLVGSDTTSPYGVTWSGVAAGTYSLTARAIDNAGAATTSAAVSIIVASGSGPLPSPWVQQDIGAVGRVGSATEANGTWSVSGAGADVWDAADQFHYVYQPLAGDGEIVARVATEQNVSDWTKAGVMIRETTAADSRHGFMLVTPSGVKGLAFQRRVTTGGLSTNTSGGSGVPPAWVRLVRTGSTIIAYRSADGAAWTRVGSDTIAMGASVTAGLAVSSHSSTELATATFDHVSVTVTSASVPSPWAQQDIGGVGLSGSATLSGSTWTVTGAGADVWGTADQFHFVYQPLVGDGTITARVATEQTVNDWTKAGVMIRGTLSADSVHGFMLVTPSGVKGLAFQRRVTTGGLSTNTSGGSGSPPAWVRITRSGSTITAYRSADGVTWTLVGSDSIPMGSTVFAGLAVTSHDATQRATATFDNVTVTAAAP